jgi:hypothetical protein
MKSAASEFPDGMPGPRTLHKDSITKARKAKTRRKKSLFFRAFVFRTFVIRFFGAMPIEFVY